MDLFKPVKLGAFQLQHRVVISPPYRAQGGDQKYCKLLAATELNAERVVESLAPEGGLVLVPPYPVLDVKTHQAIVEAIHKAGGIAFCRGKNQAREYTM